MNPQSTQSERCESLVVTRCLDPKRRACAAERRVESTETAAPLVCCCGTDEPISRLGRAHVAVTLGPERGVVCVFLGHFFFYLAICKKLALSRPVTDALLEPPSHRCRSNALQARVSSLLLPVRPRSGHIKMRIIEAETPGTSLPLDSLWRTRVFD